MRRLLSLFFALALALPLAARADDPPSVSFFGVEAPGTTRTVFLIDHSTSMKNFYDPLQKEVSRCVCAMDSSQSFAIFALSNTIDGNYPNGGTLATPDPKSVQNMNQFMARLLTRGNNDKQLEPFASAFKKAFTLDPQTIYFLVDGSVDPKLVDTVAELNAKRKTKVRVYILGYVKVEAKTEEALKKIATDSGGSYRLVTENEVTR